MAAGEPAPGGRTSQGTAFGKTKRIRRVFAYAADHDVSAGLLLAKEIVALLRADGRFSSTLPEYADAQKISRLAITFKGFGLMLAENGGLRPTVIDNLGGMELTETLRTSGADAHLPGVEHKLGDRYGGIEGKSGVPGQSETAR